MDPGSKGGPNMNNHIGGGADPVPQSSEVISADILAREPVANNASVKHILIGWKDLDQAADERAKKRTKSEAEGLVRSLMTQIKAGADFDMLMKAALRGSGQRAERPRLRRSRPTRSS